MKRRLQQDTSARAGAAAAAEEEAVDESKKRPKIQRHRLRPLPERVQAAALESLAPPGLARLVDEYLATCEEVTDHGSSCDDLGEFTSCIPFCRRHQCDVYPRLWKDLAFPPRVATLIQRSKDTGEQVGDAITIPINMIIWYFRWVKRPARKWWENRLAEPEDTDFDEQEARPRRGRRQGAAAAAAAAPAHEEEEEEEEDEEEDLDAVVEIHPQAGDLAHMRFEVHNAEGYEEEGPPDIQNPGAAAWFIRQLCRNLGSLSHVELWFEGEDAPAENADRKIRWTVSFPTHPHWLEPLNIEFFYQNDHFEGYSGNDE